MKTDDRLRTALGVIESLEAALFKIACGQSGQLVLSRADMLDIAEEVLPKHLQERCMMFGKAATRKARAPRRHEWYHRHQGEFE